MMTGWRGPRRRIGLPGWRSSIVISLIVAAAAVAVSSDVTVAEDAHPARVAVWADHLRSSVTADIVPFDSLPLCLALPRQSSSATSLVETPVQIIADTHTFVSNAPICTAVLDVAAQQRLCELVRQAFCYRFVLEGEALTEGGCDQEALLGVYNTSTETCRLNAHLVFTMSRNHDTMRLSTRASGLDETVLPSNESVRVVFTYSASYTSTNSLPLTSSGHSTMVTVISLLLVCLLVYTARHLDRLLHARLSPSTWTSSISGPSIGSGLGNGANAAVTPLGAHEASPMVSHAGPPTHVRQLRDDLVQAPARAEWIAWALSVGAQGWAAVLVLLESLVLGVASPNSFESLVVDFAVMHFGATLVFGYHLARLEKHLFGRTENLPWHAVKALASYRLPYDSIKGAGSNDASAAATRQRWFHMVRVVTRGTSFALGCALAVAILGHLRDTDDATTSFSFRLALLVCVLWLAGTPLGLIGYWLGSQGRPLFTLVDRRTRLAFGVVVVILVALGYGLFVVALAGAFLAHSVCANEVVLCKERRITVSPWHTSSQVRSASAGDVIALAIGVLACGLAPYLCVIDDYGIVLDLGMGFQADESLGTTLPLFIGFAFFCLCSFLVGVIATSVTLIKSKGATASIHWRGYLSGAASAPWFAFQSVLYALRAFSSAPSIGSVVFYFIFAWSVALMLGLIGGFLSFSGSQKCTARILALLGSVDGRDPHLTLNGVRYNPPSALPAASSPSPAQSPLGGGGNSSLSLPLAQGV